MSKLYKGYVVYYPDAHEFETVIHATFDAAEFPVARRIAPAAASGDAADASPCPLPPPVAATGRVRGPAPPVPPVPLPVGTGPQFDGLAPPPAVADDATSECGTESGIHDCLSCGGRRHGGTHCVV